MKYKEINKKTKDELLKDISKYKKDLFNFRFQKTNSQLVSSAKINQTKKNIARINTALKGKQ